MGRSGLCISSSVREFFSTGTTKLAPYLRRHRNRALQACIQMELYFSLECWGKNGCTKLSSDHAVVAVPDNEAQDVHLNSWV